MKRFGGMLTFDTKGGMEAAKKLVTVTPHLSNIKSSMLQNYCSLVFRIERPILGDNPKAHNHDNEKRTLFVKSMCFLWKACTFCEKYLCFSWKATKTVDSTQIFHFDLVFHRVQREGQPMCLVKTYEKHMLFTKDHLQGIVTLRFILLHCIRTRTQDLLFITDSSVKLCLEVIWGPRQ